MSKFFQDLSLNPSEEPVLVTGLLTAVLEVAIAFGAPIDPGQKTALMLLIGTVAAFFIRGNVYPEAHVDPVPAVTLETK